MVEFAIVFPIQLFMTFVFLQFAHVFLAKIVINHAAYAAARAAIIRPDNVTIEDWTRDEVLPAAVMICAPITGVSPVPDTLDTSGWTTWPLVPAGEPGEGPTDIMTIPGWNSDDPTKTDELFRSDIAKQKTLVRVTENGRDVVAEVRYDFELIFLADVTLLDIWSTSNVTGPALAEEYDDSTPHLRMTESCNLRRMWNVGGSSLPQAP